MRLCCCAILVFNKRNIANSLPLYIVKKDACVKCTYTVCECLLLPHDAAMLARSWEFCLSVRPSVTRVLYCFVTNPKNIPAIFLYHVLITANMQSKTGFPSCHQLKSYVAMVPPEIRGALSCKLMLAFLLIICIRHLSNANRRST